MFGQQTALFDAYLATDYVAIERRGETTIRIGRRSTAVDRLLSRHGARTAVFVTAWNPFSKNVGRLTNAILHAQLRSWLKRRCLAHLPGEVAEQSGIGLPKKASWFLVFNVRSPALSVEPFAKMRLYTSPLANHQSSSCCDKPGFGQVDASLHDEGQARRSRCG